MSEHTKLLLEEARMITRMTDQALSIPSQPREAEHDDICWASDYWHMTKCNVCGKSMFGEEYE